MNIKLFTTMKTKLFLFVSLLFVSSFAFGQREMTDEEKIAVQEDASFIENCKQAVRNYAAFYSTNDGSSASTEALRITWAKHRIMAINFLLFDVDDPNIGYRFMNASKGKTLNLGAAPQPASVIVEAWVDAATFEEYTAAYFTLRGDDINFSIGN